MESPNARVFLKDTASFPAWFLQLQFNCSFRNVWYIVDPAAPDAPLVVSQEPSPPPTIDSLIAALDARRQEALIQWEEEGRTRAERGPRPVVEPATFADIEKEHAARYKEYTVLQSSWSLRSSRYQQIWDWIRTTVDQALLAPHLEKLTRSPTALSLQAIVRSLQQELAPSEDHVIERVRMEYRTVLKHAHKGSISLNQWHSDWYRAYQRALSHNLAEVQGPLAVIDFLEAVSKLIPDWGRQQLTGFVTARELHEPLRTLDQYGRVFASLVEHEIFQDRYDPANFTTLGGRSNSPASSCPCKASRQEKHPWKPSECAILEIAVKGYSTRATGSGETPSPEQLESVRQRLLGKGYESLRAYLKAQGWQLPEAQGQALGAYPGKVAA